MSSTFFAIPLPECGESFLLRTTTAGGDKAILVDTGREVWPSRRSEALDTFLAGFMPDLVTIDRLILTHEDDDHCGGAAQFIANWINSKRSIEEVWLPSMWAPAGAGPARCTWVRSRIVKGALQAAPEIARAIERLAREQDQEIAGDVERRAATFDDDLVMAAVSDAASESDAFSGMFEASEGQTRAAGIDQPLEIDDPDFSEDDLRSDHYSFSQREGLYGRDSLIHLAVAMMEHGEVPWPKAGQRRDAGLALAFLDGVLDTHPRIAEAIAACAFFDLPIRWFDFKQFEKSRTASGGDPEFLTPVNAVEVRLKPKPVSPKTLFYALALSRANRECLAYLRHEEGAEPPVLFTGDSRLTTRRKPFPRPRDGLPSQRNLLVTAMHHASNHNEQGYAVLKTWLGLKYPPLFIRNGGHGVRTPAPSFLRTSNRLCVRCIGSSLPDLAIRLEATGGRWRMPAHPRRCVCK